jgi:hypothetical protein
MLSRGKLFESECKRRINFQRNAWNRNQILYSGKRKHLSASATKIIEQLKHQQHDEDSVPKGTPYLE